MLGLETSLKTVVSSALAGEDRFAATRPPKLWALLRGTLLAVCVILPVILVVSAVRSYEAVESTRQIYLRSRAATIALQLELLPADEQRIEQLIASELDIADIDVFSEVLPAADPEAPYVNPILRGKALYFSQESRPVYRSYLPVHHTGASPELQVARIETYSDAADFLVHDALRHLTITLLAAVGSLATLGAYLLVLRRSNRLARLAQLGTMSAALAHEIRNPLGTIKGFVQLARERSDSAASSFLDTAGSEIGRLERLVRDLLLFARPQTATFQRVAWNDILTRLGRPQSNGEAQLELQSRNGLVLKTDADVLVELLSNLVRNAAEAAPQGKVCVRAEPEGRMVRILVEDEGPGIPEDLRRRVFEPFFSTKASGTGLGLPIARALAGQLGARLELAARSPRGTVAQVVLPAALDDGGGNGPDPRR
jgi:signal transduction histidine kinase